LNDYDAAVILVFPDATSYLYMGMPHIPVSCFYQTFYILIGLFIF